MKLKKFIFHLAGLALISSALYWLLGFHVTSTVLGDGLTAYLIFVLIYMACGAYLCWIAIPDPKSEVEVRQIHHVHDARNARWN